MELWDLYDEKRSKLGKTHIRGQRLPENGYHLVVHVWITDGRGNYLISRRAESRPSFPLMWECVGGSVVAGEDSLTGALRETKEEVGVDLDPERGEVVFSKTRGLIDGERYNDIMDVWLFHYDGEPSLENATTDEVAQVKWMSLEEIRSLDASGDLVPNLKYFFDKIAA